jgi:hypothetical protein
MKELPDEKILLEMLEVFKDAELTYSPVKLRCDGGFSQNHFLRLLAQRDDLNLQHLC